MACMCEDEYHQNNCSQDCDLCIFSEENWMKAEEEAEDFPDQDEDNIQYLLNNRLTLIRYNEPLLGIDANGNSVVGNTSTTATVFDIINSMRKKYPNLSDQQLLEEYMIVNWAYPVKSTS